MGDEKLVFEDKSEKKLSKAFKAQITNKIFCEEALKTLRSWPKAIVDACITDPPYNIARNKSGLTWAFSSHITMQSDWDRFSPKEYEDFTFSWMKELTRVIKPNGNIFIFGTYHNIYTIGAIAKKLNLKIINSIIWAKPNAQPNITCRMFTESTEQVIWLCNNNEEKAKNWTFNYKLMKAQNDGKQMRNFWLIPLTPKNEREYGHHPAQKPLKLMERIVLASTNPNDLVLDCFAGSGSTLIACQNNQRNFVGIEKKLEFCEIAKQRLGMLEQIKKENF